MNNINKGRGKIEYIDSIPFSELIILIAAGYNNINTLSRIRKKDVSVIAKQLRYLLKDKFLIYENEERQKTSLFLVNWKIIINNLYDYYFENNDLIYKNESSEKIKLFEGLTIKFSKGSIDKNPYLIEFLKTILKEFGRNKSKISLREVFDFIPYIIDTNDYLKNKGQEHLLIKAKKDNKFHEFLSFIVCIHETYFCNNFYDGLDKGVSNFFYNNSLADLEIIKVEKIGQSKPKEQKAILKPKEDQINVEVFTVPKPKAPSNSKEQKAVLKQKIHAKI